jgi:flagellar basal body-associated protein FliL
MLTGVYITPFFKKRIALILLLILIVFNLYGLCEIGYLAINHPETREALMYRLYFYYEEIPLFTGATAIGLIFYFTLEKKGN